MELISRNEHFINGTWYNNEYKSGWYKKQYIDTPEPSWAVESKRWCVDFLKAVLQVDSGKVLDIGAGVGQFMNIFEQTGFECYGIEISQEAVDIGRNVNQHDRLIQGTAADLPYTDNMFDIAFSSSVLEHIDETILPDVMHEMYRVSTMQAHYIGLDHGSDPSHINIKTVNEWLDVFNEYAPDDYLCAAINNPLEDEGPLFIVMPQSHIHHRLKEALLR